MALPQKKNYTIDDINNLPEGTLAELIDGQIYYQALPSKTHQSISGELSFIIKSYIKSNKGKCLIYTAPFDIFINGDESDCFIPNISIICNPDIVKERGCYGAPDWIIEITSPSNSGYDYFTKSAKYQAAGYLSIGLISCFFLCPIANYSITTFKHSEV